MNPKLILFIGIVCGIFFGAAFCAHAEKRPSTYFGVMGLVFLLVGVLLATEC